MGKPFEKKEEKIETKMVFFPSVLLYFLSVCNEVSGLTSLIEIPPTASKYEDDEKPSKYRIYYKKVAILRPELLNE